MFCRVHISAALAAVSLSLFAGWSVRAEIAPPGTYLPARDYLGTPAPTGRYRTRMGWTIASMHEHLEGGLLAPFTLPPLYRRVIDQEDQHIRALTPARRQAYKYALLRDIAVVELNHFDRFVANKVASEFIEDVVLRVLSNVLATGLTDLLLPTPGIGKIALPLPDHPDHLGINRKMTVERWVHLVETRYPRMMDQTLLGDFNNFVAASRKLNGTFRSVRDVTELLPEAVIEATMKKAAASLVAQDDGLRALRRQITADLAINACACEALVPNPYAPPAAWDLVLPAVTETYQTRFGRLLAAEVITGPGIGRSALVEELLTGEKAFLARLRDDPNPAAFAGYLRRFLGDVDRLQDDALLAAAGSPIAAFASDVAVEFFFGAVGLAGGTTAGVAAVMIDAGFASVAEYDRLGVERKIRVDAGKLRNQVLALLESIGPVCSCGAVAVGPKQVITGRLATPEENGDAAARP